MEEKLKNEIIRKLVSVVPQDEIEDDLPIEYYELREFAKKRVILRSSFKTHIILYTFFNTILFIYNYRQDLPELSTIMDLWVWWIILSWGIALFAHGALVVSQNIHSVLFRTFQQKIFFIVAWIALYLSFFLIYVNNQTNSFTENSFRWWPYSMALIVIFLVAYWFTIRDIDEPKLELNIQAEIKKIRAEYENEIDKQPKSPKGNKPKAEKQSNSE